MAVATLKTGFELSNNLFDPLGWSVSRTERMRNFYQNHPIGARFVTGSANTVLGVVKVFSLPFQSAIGAVALPAIACYKHYQGDHQRAKEYWATWGFQLIAGAGVISFLMLSAFHMNLLQGTVVVMTGSAISVTIHVYRVMKEPKQPVELPQPQAERPQASL